MANLGSLIATLGVKLGPLRSGFRKAEQSFQDYEKRAKGSIKRVSSAVFGLRSALIGLGGTLLVRQFVKTADALSLVEGRLKLVTNSAEELATVQTELLRIANDTRNAYQGTADLYARVGRVTRDLDVSQKDLLQTTKTINQALIVSGAAAQEASAALVQLSQGLASGTLRGDELRSVLEQTPRLARAIAEGLGVTIGQLRELGTQGELTADRVIKALLSQRDVIEQEFSKMPKTVGQSFVVLNNIVGSIIKRINDSTAATGVMISLIEDFGKVINATFTVVEKSFADIEKSGVAADMAITIRNKLGKALEYTALAVAAVSDAWLGLKEVWQVLKIAYATFAEYVNKGLEWIMKRINDLLAVFQKVIAGLHADFRAAGLDFLADQFQKSHLFVVRTRVALTGMTKQLRNNQYFWSGVKEEAKDTLGILAAQETNLQKTKKLIEAVKTEMENMDAAEAAIQKADEAAASVGEALNLLPDENAKALKKMEKQYEDWQNTVGDMFTDFWINTFEHTGDAFEKLKMDMLRTFTSMLAKMATEAIAKPIFIPYIQGAAQALGLNIPGIQSTSGMVPSALSKVSEMLGLKETLDLFGVGMDKLGIAKGAAGIGSFMNAPLYGQQMVNVPGAGMAAIPGTGVTPFGLLGAGVSGYNAYQSFQAEDYGRAVYQATTAAMWAIPGMQPIAALMSIGDLIGIDDLMSNLGEWIGDRFNDPATFRGKYGLQAGQNFNILTNPALAFGTSLNFQDQQQTELQNRINTVLDESIGETLRQISTQLNTLIREGVIDLEDIPPNFMLDTINRLNVELGLKEYPDIFQQNLERNLKNWHNVLVEESNKFLKLPLQRLEFQLSMVPFEELRKRATGEQGTLADLKETFENLSFALDRLNENSETFYTDALMILTEQVNVQQEIKRLTDTQLSQADSAIGTMDTILRDLDKMSGLDVTSQTRMEGVFSEFVQTLLTSGAYTFEELASSAAQFAQFIPDFIAFQQAFGGDTELLVSNIRDTVETIRSKLVEEREDLLISSITNLTEAIDKTTEQLTNLNEARFEEPTPSPTPITITIDGQVTEFDIDAIFSDEEFLEAIQETIKPLLPRPGGTYPFP